MGLERVAAYQKRVRVYGITPEQAIEELYASGLMGIDLARRIGVTPQAVSKWAHGGRLQRHHLDALMEIYTDRMLETRDGQPP